MKKRDDQLQICDRVVQDNNAVAYEPNNAAWYRKKKGNAEAGS